MLQDVILYPYWILDYSHLSRGLLIKTALLGSRLNGETRILTHPDY